MPRTNVSWLRRVASELNRSDANPLCGGRGNDRLTGGAGADRFSGGPGTDLAADLTPGQGDSQDGTIP